MRVRVFLVTCIILNSFVLSFAQGIHKSIHQLESEYYSSHPDLYEKEEQSKPNLQKRVDLMSPVSLSSVVYGFHPSWVGDSKAANYYYPLLSHVAYFSAEVDTSVTTTGGFRTTNNWSSTSVVNYAHSYGAKVHLVITMFAHHDRVLASSTYRQNLVNNIVTQVNLRGADGVNIDFESMSSSQASNFSFFINLLGTTLKEQGKELVIDLPDIDWTHSIYSSSFFSANNPVVSYYFIMAYDVYWSGSSTAGPVSPLSNISSSVTNSINNYLTAGAPSTKLIAGFPYYGFDWSVVSSAYMASVQPSTSGTSITYSSAKTKLASIPSGDKYFDATYSSPWYRYQSGSQWHQVWYDDSLSLSYKYDLVKSSSLAGTGIWALSYDGSNSELWGAIKDKFASKPNPAFTQIADFEYGVGKFDKAPTFSGSTTGISKLSTASRSTLEANNGDASLCVVLKDSSTLASNWVVRLLSGGGSVSNNTALNPSGYIGFWMKTSTAPTGAQVALTLDDPAGGTELSAKLNVINDGKWNLYQWQLPGSGWVSFASGNGKIDGPTVTLDAVMLYAPKSSSDWMLYIDDVSHYASGPLPVELTSFNSYFQNNEVLLKWTTATEVNSSKFVIERKILSEQNSLWITIGEVLAAGNRNSPKDYTFIDSSPVSGKVQYRLKQIDNDGIVKFYDAIFMDIDAPGEYSLMQNTPNPFNPVTAIKFQLPENSFVTLTIYDLLGREVTTLVSEMKPVGSYITFWNGKDSNGKNVSSGVYLYRLSAGKYIATKKMNFIK